MAVDRPTWEAFYAARAENPASSKTKRLRDKLVKDNMGLVKSVAIRHAKASRTGYEDADDMIQAGAIGLMQAIEKFKLEMGYAFTTYAMFWIRREFQLLREKDEPIRKRPGQGMPFTVQARMNAFRQKFGYEPSPGDLGEWRGAPVTQKQLDEWARFPVVVSMQETTPAQREADDKADGDGLPGGAPGFTGGHAIADTAPLADEVLIAEEEHRELFEEIEDVLSPSERAVAIAVLFDGHEDTDIARERKTSRSAVGQLRRRALDKLAEGRKKAA